MTDKEIFQSLNEFIYNYVNVNTTLSAVDIYEKWRQYSGIIVHRPDLAAFLLECIENMKNYNRDKLKDAMNI